MARSSGPRALLIQLEFPNWHRARSWAFSANYGIRDALLANGIECFTVPAIADIPSTASDSWLFHARRLYSRQRFDQAWVWLVHTPLDEAFLDWLTTIAPVRIGILMESLRYDAEDYAVAPNLLDRPARLAQQLRYLTHLLVPDERDVVEIRTHRQAEVLWCPTVVPERCVVDAAKEPSDPHAVFHGMIYGERSNWISHPALHGRMVFASSPISTPTQRLFDLLQQATMTMLQSGVEVAERSLGEYVENLYRIRLAEFTEWMQGLAQWTAVVNLPSMAKFYGGRVFEGMAAGRPIISWDIPNHPRNRALFEPDREILLFDKRSPETLAEQIDHLQSDPGFARNIAGNARDKIRRYHTAEARIGQVLRWIETGTEPDYGEKAVAANAVKVDRLNRSVSATSKDLSLIADKAKINEYYVNLFVRNPITSTPHPGPDERARWTKIEAFLKHIIHETAATRTGRALRILDVGCGRGWLTNLASAYGEAEGVEPVAEVVNYARACFPRLRFFVGTPETVLESPEFTPYDIILSSEVIEHIPHREQSEFIASLRRLLNPGGHVILTTPRAEAFEQFRRYYTPDQPVEDWLSEQQLASLFTRQGFRATGNDRIWLSTPDLSYVLDPTPRDHHARNLMGVYQVWAFQSGERESLIPDLTGSVPLSETPDPSSTEIVVEQGAARASSPASRSVLIVCTHFPPSVGGLETIAAQLGKSLIAKGYDVHVATERSEKREFKEYCGIIIHSLDPVPLPEQRLPLAVQQLRELILSGRYDACILLADPRNWIFWSLEGLEVPEHTRIIAQPLINAEGFARWRDNRTFRTRLTQILKRAHSVVAISTGGAIVQYLSEEGIPYVYIPNAVEREKGSDDFRARYGIPESVPLLLHIANLWPVKNHLGLMDALSTMDGDWRLVMIGHSSGDSQYDRQVRDAVQRDPRFMLIPGLPRHDVAAALDTADILLLASHGEVAPVTVLEAMSHATPWLASPQCGGVHDNAGGLIVPLEQFPQALSWLLKDRQTLDRLGQAGYRHWSECFGWDIVISAWDSLIQTGASSATFEIPAPIGEEIQRIRDGIPQSLRGGFTTPASASAVDPPLVSVIVPTCNRLASVRTTLDSIVGQTYPNLEIIIVNDGEADLQELVNAYRTQRPVTYVVHDRNRGTGASRNTGLKLGRGKYIAYLDDDDRYLPEHIAVLASALDAHPDHVAAYSLATEVTQIERDRRCEPLRRQVNYNRPFDPHQMLVANYIPNLCLMHRRSACEKIGGHDEELTMLEDWEFLIRLSRIGEFVHIPKVTAEYYVNIGSSHRNRVGEQAISITRAIYERYVDHAIPAVRQAQQLYLERLSAVVRRPDDNPQASVRVEEVAALVHQAEQYVTEGDLAAAQQRLNQALEIRPGEPQLIVMLGNVLLRLGDIESARREFTKATILHPQCVPAHADLAAVLLHLGRPAEAETSARKTIELEPTNVSALKVLGRICLDTERYQEAVQAYATILQYDPNDIETLILVGNCYAEVGRPEEAKAFYYRVLQLDPDHAVAVENLAVVSGQQPSSTPTSPVVEETIESEPRYVSTDVSDGRMPRIRVEASPDASSIREETVSPRSSSVGKVTELFQRVETHMKNEDLDAASRVLTEAVAQAPEDPDLIVASGHVAWKQGELDRARLQFVRAATLEPNYVQAHAALAVLFLQQRRFAEAEEAARKALAIDATEVTALKVLARICLDTERYQEAVQAYATILDRAPDDIETLILVGNCYAESGRFEQARSFYRKVLALDPGNAVAAENLAEVDRLVSASDETTSESMAPVVHQGHASVSIVIVTYNSASTIRACLDSVLRESRPATDLIVVDNLSTDETRSILREYEVRIATILNSENVGFSAACNQGIRASSGEYVVLLNPDTVVTAGWLDRLIGHFGHEIGAVGPVSDYAADLQNIDRHLPDGAPRRMGLDEVSNLLGRVNAGKGVETKLLTGFCMMVPRKVLDEVGLLDETLFLGNDDLDLSWRSRLKGYKLLVATDTFVRHEGQVSFKCEAKTKTSRLVQESTDRLYAKLVAHYGPGNVPSPMELWGIDWFKPTMKTEDRIASHASRLTSIIILTHNGLEHTRQCLASIEAHTPEPYELIIVDNGSTDGTLDYLHGYTADHDNARVVANLTNRGFAAGNNQGLALARGDCLLLLNNDTIATEGWLTRMLRIFEAHSDVGVVGPMSNHVSGPQLVRDASYGDLKGLDAFAAGWAQSHDGQNVEATRVVGFCLLTRKEVIARIGGLDERFGSGNFEDDDFCIRAFQVGFRARIALDVFVHHTGSQTFKTAKIDYRQSLMRNWELFKAKWGILADAPYEKGYRFPPPSAENVPLSVPLPDVGADHRCGGDGRWWQEIGEDHGRCEPAVTEETRFNAIIVPNGHGIAPLWPSLVQHTNQPLAITIVPSIRNGHAGEPLHAPACPDGWQIGTGDIPAVQLLNRLFQSAGDEPVILLSGEMVVTPGWLKRLLTACERNPHLAMVGPAMNDGLTPQLVKADYKGTGKALRQSALRRAHRYGKQLAVTDHLVPSCIVFNPVVCRTIGPLREDLDLAASLADFGVRVREAGLTVATALDTYVHCDQPAAACRG